MSIYCIRCHDMIVFAECYLADEVIDEMIRTHRCRKATKTIDLDPEFGYGKDY